MASIGEARDDIRATQKRERQQAAEMGVPMRDVPGVATGKTGRGRSYCSMRIAQELRRLARIHGTIVLRIRGAASALQCLPRTEEDRMKHRCNSCGVLYTQHNGIQGTCADNLRLRAALIALLSLLQQERFADTIAVKNAERVLDGLDAVSS
jgi:hypothetical protein